MTKRLNSKFRVDRKLLQNTWDLAKSSFNKKPYKPGMHKKKVIPRKISIKYLHEFSKMKAFYANTSKKYLLKLFRETKKHSNQSLEFIKTLEKRLDTVIFRLGFVRTPFEARQIINHKHVLVNNEIMKNPSTQINVSDKITFNNKIKELIRINSNFIQRTQPIYLNANKNFLEGKFIQEIQDINNVTYPFSLDIKVIIAFLRKIMLYDFLKKSHLELNCKISYLKNIIIFSRNVKSKSFFIQKSNKIPQYFSCVVFQEEYFNIQINFFTKFYKKIIKDIKICINTMLKNIKTNQGNEIIIDSFGINLGKSLHLGHLRSIFIGSYINNLFKSVGLKSSIHTHLGDIGYPIAKILNFCKDHNINIKKQNLNVLNKIYSSLSSAEEENCEETDENKQNVLETLLKLQNKDFEYEKFLFFREQNISYFKQTLKTFKLKIDYWKSELDYIFLCNKITEKIKDKYFDCINKESSSSKYLEIKTKKCPLVRENGSFLYITIDLACILYRESMNCKKIFYVTDYRQLLHFKKLFSIYDIISPKNKIQKTFLGYGMIKSDNKPITSRNSKQNNTIAIVIKNLKEQLYNKYNKVFSTSFVCALLKINDLNFNHKTDYDIENLYSEKNFFILNIHNAIKKQLIYQNFKEIENNLDFQNSQLLIENIIRVLYSCFYISQKLNFKQFFDAHFIFCQSFNELCINKDAKLVLDRKFCKLLKLYIKFSEIILNI